MRGTRSSVRTRVILEVGRLDAEYLTKHVGPRERRGSEASKDRGPARAVLFYVGAVGAMGGPPALPTCTSGGCGQPGWAGGVLEDDDDSTLHTASEEQREEIRRESLARYGILYAEAERNVQEALTADNLATSEESSPDPVVPAYEVVAV
jgi:hypothetical protein